MGRSSAGGSSGGGRSSGGSRGGSSRSFGGGRSSSGRSSRSSGGGSFNIGSSLGSYGRRYVRRGYNYGRSYGTTVINNYGSAAMNRYGFISFFITTILVFALILSITVITKSMEVQPSTIKRTKLEAELCTPTKDSILDYANWGLKGSSKVTRAIDYFYKKTGVQPIIVAMEGIDGDLSATDQQVEAKMNSLYDDVVKDEGHAMFMYVDFGGGDWGLWYLVGNQARSVIDQEACQIVQDYFTRYSTSSLNDQDYFAKCLRESADRIMTKTPSPWRYVALIFVIVAVIIIVAIVINASIKKKQLRIQEMEEANKILNSDI